MNFNRLHKKRIQQLLAKGLPLAFLLSFFLSCHSNLNKDTGQFPLTLVRRSVLDQQVRMLSLCFGTDRFVAYNLESAQLEKIWRGGVLWNGAAFNNLKTVQPESFGTIYWESSAEEGIWSIEKDGQRLTAAVAFRGYSLLDKRIRLQYILRDHQGNESIVNEYPHFLEKDTQAFYQRDFEVVEAAPGTMIYFGASALDLTQKTSIKQALGAVPASPPPAQAINDNSSQYWLERSGCNTCHYQSEMQIGPSYEAIAGRYERNDQTVTQLITKIKQGGSGQWGTVAMIPHPDVEEADIKRMVTYILSLRPVSEEKAAVKFARPAIAANAEVNVPGFGAPVAGVHPAYDLVNFRPAGFKPRVGGMAFLPDGTLLVSTWDSLGAVYAITGVASGDSSQVSIRQIASGLSEPLGLTTVGRDIYVLQKHELTQLIDTNGDGLIDEYRSINHSFGATPDFHEFSYGLVQQDGYFYGGLGLAMRLMAHELQNTDRGIIFKIGLDGSFEKIADGLRQPNGIGIGPDQEIFVTENQGQWTPACKFIHVKPDSFYGCQFGTGDRYAGRQTTPPAVWMPQDEIGNSPSQPLLMQHGPYQGQMIYGEVTHGGIKRVFLEKIDGEYQGCVFRFSQGLEAGINRMAWGPDGGLYVGGVGMNGNWAHLGHQYGLQKLVYNGRVPFELLALRARPDGFELEFTESLPASIPDIRQKIRVQQWRYEATPAYGGPKLDQEELSIAAAKLSPDGKKLSLQIPKLKAGYVIYFLLDQDLLSQSGKQLWSGETWYTLNHIPVDF